MHVCLMDMFMYVKKHEGHVDAHPIHPRALAYARAHAGGFGNRSTDSGAYRATGIFILIIVTVIGQLVLLVFFLLFITIVGQPVFLFLLL